MVVETVRMSSKGQIVIPQDLREELQVHEGTIFAVVGSNDTIILKKVKTISKEELFKELETMAIEGKKRAKKLGIEESDVPEMIRRIRDSRRKK